MIIDINDTLRDHLEPEDAFLYFLQLGLNEERFPPTTDIRRKMRQVGYSTSEIFFAQELLKGTGAIKERKEVGRSLPYDTVFIPDTHKPAYSGLVEHVNRKLGLGFKPTT